MTTANVHQAKTNLSKLLDAAERGDEVIITRRGGAVTKFKLVPQITINAKRSRLRGSLKDKIHYAPDYDKADAEIIEIIESRLD